MNRPQRDFSGVKVRTAVEPRQRRFGWETSKWDCYFWFVAWDCLQLGFHVCLGAPNVEIHVPFGFVRIGRRTITQYVDREAPAPAAPKREA